MDQTLSFLYLSSASVISALIGAYAWRHRELQGCRAFAVLILVSIAWMLGSIEAVLSDDPTAQWIGQAVQSIGIVSVPPALLVFVYRYCGRNLDGKRILRLAIVPAISWMVLAAPFSLMVDMLSGTHGSRPQSVFRTYYFWWVHIPYSYTLLALSLARVFVEIRRAPRNYRGQVIMLLTAMCVPVTADLIGLSGIFGKTNLSPFSFLLFFIMVGISMYRYQFLGNNPIAYETVFHAIRDSVIILDRDDVVRDINRAASIDLKKEAREVIGLPLRTAFSESPEFVSAYDMQKGREGDIHDTLMAAKRFLSLDVRPVKDRNGALAGQIVVLQDVTDRKQQQIELETMAFHDPLTKLANRRKLEEEVERATQRTWETGRHFALLYFDLDRFKVVNDTLGHDVGDELLKYVASRVTSILRKPDLLARMGGDEFAVLLHDSDEMGVEHVVERMLGSIQRPFHIGEHTLSVGLSIGAAFYPANGQSLAQLLRHADSAMYRAKSQGGGLNLYSPGSELEN